VARAHSCRRYSIEAHLLALCTIWDRTELFISALTNSTIPDVLSVYVCCYTTFDPVTDVFTFHLSNFFSLHFQVAKVIGFNPKFSALCMFLPVYQGKLTFPFHFCLNVPNMPLSLAMFHSRTLDSSSDMMYVHIYTLPHCFNENPFLINIII